MSAVLPPSPLPAASPPPSPDSSGKSGNATWSHVRHVLSENPVTLLAAALFTLFVAMALVGPYLVPYDPLASNSAVALQPPSATHWFGTDALGRDIFSRVVVATRLDLGIAVSAVVASFVIGMPLGLAAGFFGGWWDRIVTRLSDTIMAFPLFVLAMGIVAALGNTVGNIVLATAVINLPFYIRVARAEANVRRNAGWIEAARLSGNSDLRILALHLFPNSLPPAMVQVSLNMGWAILNAAGLSYIGLGVRPPEPEWGILVAEGAQFIVSGEWWVSFFPGMALMLAVFTFNLLGDALRDIFDPRRRT
jgi:peptide/nickel transport system permease protein